MTPAIRLWGRVFVKPGVKGKLGIEFDPSLHETVEMNIKELSKKSGQSWAFVEIKPPKRPITTGPRSQMAWIHGQCTFIAQQLSGKGIMYSMEDVKTSMKSMARELGYPTKLGIDGFEYPVSLSEATMDDAKAVTQIICDFADRNGLYLYAYDDNNQLTKTMYGENIRRFRDAVETNDDQSARDDVERSAPRV